MELKTRIVDHFAPNVKHLPAAKQTSERWFVRVDGEETFLRQKCEELGGWHATVNLHAVFHKGKKGENPHVHFITTYIKSLQKQAYDLHIKKLFGCVGTSYSTKPWDGEFNGAGSYLYHEEEDIDNPTQVFATKGFEEIHINSMKEYAKEWREQVNAKKQKASLKLEERAMEHFTAADEPKLYDIWEFMWALIRKGECYNPGDHHLRKYALAVFAKYGTEEDWNTFVSNSFDRAFPTPYQR